MTRATIRQLLAQRVRLIGVGLAIMIGVGFGTATLLSGNVIDQGFRNSVGAEYRSIDFVLEAQGESFTLEVIGEVEGLDGVADVQMGSPLWIEAQAGGRTAPVIAIEVPDAGGLRDGLALDSGQLPETAGEIALLRSAARELRVELGDTVDLMVPASDDPDSQLAAREFSIVGLWTGEGRFGPDEITAFLPREDLALWSDQAWISILYVIASPQASQAEVEAALGELVGGRATVTTAQQRIDHEMREFADETAVQKIGVAAFGLIALIVAGIVVSNTFAILVAQRTREIALFRCAGATARQVRGMVLAEAIAVGVAASAIGVVASILVTNAVLRFVNWQFAFDSVPAGIGVSLPVLVGPLLAGVLVAAGAAWAPARTATRVDPLEALRIAYSPLDTWQRAGSARIVLALLSLAGGGALLIGGLVISRAGSREIGILAGIAGGLVTWLGVLLGASILVPATVTMVNRIVSRTGSLPARVAASNSVRNPRRTTGTTIALVIGVALVTMMSVGAESLKATMFGEIDFRTPWDLEIVNAGGTLDDGSFIAFTQSVAEVDGVVAQITPGRLEAVLPGQRPEDSIPFDARVVDPDDLANVWRDDEAVSGLGPGVALTPSWFLDLAGVADGETFTLEIGGERHEYRAEETAAFESVLIGDDLPGPRNDAVIDTVWLRLDDDADPDRVLDDIYDLADRQGLTIDAGDMSGYRQTLTSALDALLLVITALLGVAVLIAVIGVGNTLSLSVIERTRESALLRALGFTKRQLRQSLAIEGTMLSMIGALIGIALGAGFGWIGAATVVGNAWPVSLAFPMGRIGLVLVVALVCGLLASIFPARRAARAEPIEALADV